MSDRAAQAVLRVESDAEDALDALTAASLFRCLDRALLRQLAPRFTRVHVRAGDMLVRHGDDGDALFIVVYGRLRVLLSGGSGRERAIGEVGRGDTVGEMAVLTGDARMGSVVAVRDSELIRLDRAEFERLTTAQPRLMLDLTRVLVTRYRDSLRESRAPDITTLAVLPADGAVDVHEFTQQLVRTLGAHGRRVLHVDAPRAEAAVNHRSGDGARAAALTAWLHGLELEHELLVFEAEPDVTMWTRASLRQADHVLVVGRGGDRPPSSAPAALAHARSGTVRPRTELVLLQDTGTTPAGTGAWLEMLPADAHHHVCRGSRRDYDRLARSLLGTATGLVLGGGGARGLAHIGVLRAFEEAGLPIDRIGGTSAGANIAAMHALGWGWERILAETRRTFVDGGSLQDYTLPVHSLLRGARYRRIGEDLYGDQRIEDLAMPFFCVSTNLTRGEAFIHRSGLLRRALRASMTVPGIAPAVFEGREVLVDGGVVNNLPVDVMRAMAPGAVIAVDVSPRQELRLDDDYTDTPSPWRSLAGRLLGRAPRIPTIATILTRAAAIPRATMESDPLRQPDLLLQPPVAGFRLLQWSAIDALVEIGYRHAQERLAQWTARVA